MSLTNLFLILKARIKIVVFIFVVTVLTAFVASMMMPKYYKASTQVVVNYRGNDSVTGNSNQSLMTSSYLATQVDIIKNRSVALSVVDALQLVDNDAMKKDFYEVTKGRGDIRQWIAGRLISRLEVSPLRESSVMEITFSGKDPQQVAEIADAFAEAYLDRTLRLKIEPVKKAANFFNQQMTTLRDSLEKAQSKLSQYQQTHGITSTDQRLDIETAKLNELSSQLVAAQASAIEANSRYGNSRKDAGNSPDVAQNPVIQNLRVEVARASAKVADLSERLGSNHPEYEAAAAELKNVQSQLYTEIARANNNIKGSAIIQQQRVEELRSALAKQKLAVLALNRQRDEMAVLQEDVETAQKALDAVTQRFTQTSIEAQSNQNDIAILSAAQVPGSPYTPRIMLNMLLAMFVGGVLGLGFGLIAEMLDRRVRSSDDIAELLKVPVVALVNKRPAVTGMKMLPGAQSGKFFPST
ncbi:MAG TPA: chain length determinant protein EpsF [Methylophilaceae bacterium]|nr:chain length determinant protein EpsF [Methylophilaceae bacterium]